MNDMKKIFTAVLLMIMGISTMNAQTITDRISDTFDSNDVYYGVRIGMNLPSLRMSSDKISTSVLPAMNFGAVIGFPLGSSSVILEPGVLYSVKGGKTSYMIDGQKDKAEVRMHGLEIPIVLKYNLTLPTMTDISIQPFFGGFFDFGLGGKTKHEGPNAKDGREKVKTFVNKFRRFDSGLRMGCGARIEFFYVEFAYDLGLSDLSRDTKAFSGLYPFTDLSDPKVGVFDSWEDTAKTGCFCINFGVNF